MTGKDLAIELGRDAGRKDDLGKLRYDLVPAYALLDVVKVLTYGAKKYGAENWRKVPEAVPRYVAAYMRHVEAHRRGQVDDPESGLPHLAHAICCLLFLLELPGGVGP